LNLALTQRKSSQSGYLFNNHLSPYLSDKVRLDLDKSKIYREELNISKVFIGHFWINITIQRVFLKRKHVKIIQSCKGVSDTNFLVSETCFLPLFYTAVKISFFLKHKKTLSYNRLLTSFVQNNDPITLTIQKLMGIQDHSK
jgi:hypothetical protein